MASSDRWQGEVVRTRLGVVAALADRAGEPLAALRDGALRAQDLAFVADRAGEPLAALRDGALRAQDLASRATGTGGGMRTASDNRWQRHG